MRTAGPSLEAIEALDVAYARFNSARSLRLIDPQLTVRDVGGLTVLRDPSRPNDELYNRIVSLTEPRLGALDAALEALAGMPPQVDVCVDRMDPVLCGALTARGLGPSRAVCWLWAEPARLATERVADVDVRRIDGEADLFIDLIGATAPAPFGPEIRAKRAHHYCTETFRAYLATVNGEPAGWATLWIHEGTGVLANAFVFPRARRRGAHLALHAARARDAQALDLAWVVTDVLPETASHRNALRAGLQRRTSYVWWRR